MSGERLAPIGVPASNSWWATLRAVRLHKLTDSLEETRGEGMALDTSPTFTKGRRERVDQRGTIALNLYPDQRRGHQDPVPTPQDLIRRVTGIGSPSRGRP